MTEATAPSIWDRRDIQVSLVLGDPMDIPGSLRSTGNAVVEGLISCKILMFFLPVYFSH